MPAETDSQTRALASAATLLAAIVDSSDDAIISKDLNGIITSWNRGAEQVFGYTAEEALGKSIAMIIPADRQDEEPRILEQLKRGERIGHFETLRRRKDGRLVNVSLSISPVRDSDGHVVGGSKIARDITQAVRAERDALLLAAIVDSSDDAIISKDLNSIVTSWNKSAERMFGYTADEMIGKPITTLFPPDREDEEPQILERLRRGERVEHFETIRRRKDGVLLEISLTISPVKDGTGRVIGASKIARDISDRKRWEAALLGSEANFRQLADSMPQMVWTARPDGTLDYYNERWYQYTGVGHEVLGDEAWKPLLHPDDLRQSMETWRESLRTGDPYQMEHRLWDRSEHRWRWFVCRALAVRDAEGNVTKWFGTSTDIDDQKRVQQELRRANQDLEQFAYSASHDLQEPLRGTKIYSELLAKRYSALLPTEAVELLAYLRQNASRMELLVRDLLAYAQIAQMPAPVEDTDANQALADTTAGLKGAIQETGAEITTDRLPSVRVHGAHLKQMLQNLLTNAIKYRSSDRVPSVHVSAEREDGYCVFAVADNGIGIEPQYCELIFGLFKRLHAHDNSGTGIGLAICQRIVERYHGRIWVESEPGHGSTFRFTLPA